MQGSFHSWCLDGVAVVWRMGNSGNGNLDDRLKLHPLERRLEATGSFMMFHGSQAKSCETPGNTCVYEFHGRWAITNLLG